MGSLAKSAGRGVTHRVAGAAVVHVAGTDLCTRAARHASVPALRGSAWFRMLRLRMLRLTLGVACPRLQVSLSHTQTHTPSLSRARVHTHHRGPHGRVVHHQVRGGGRIRFAARGGSRGETESARRPPLRPARRSLPAPRALRTGKGQWPPVSSWPSQRCSPAAHPSRCSARPGSL